MVRANPGEVTRIVVPFLEDYGFDTDAPFVNPSTQRTLQGYVWHCHILEHEDNEMMLKYRVVP